MDTKKGEIMISLSETKAGTMACAIEYQNIQISVWFKQQATKSKFIAVTDFMGK